MNIDLVAYFDSAQRTVFAERVREDEKTLVVANPVVVQVTPEIDPQTGQPTQRMSLQLLPVFFREFLASPNNDKVEVANNKDNISMITSSHGFDVKLYQQYMQIFAPREPVFPQQVPNMPMGQGAQTQAVPSQGLAPNQGPMPQPNTPQTNPINLFTGDDD